MREVADEQVEIAVVVEIPPDRADGVPAGGVFDAEVGGEGHVLPFAPGRAELTGAVDEIPFAVVHPQDVRLEPVVSHIHVDRAVAVEIGHRHAPGAHGFRWRSGPGEFEFAVVVAVAEIGKTFVLLPDFVAGNIQVHPAVAVKVRRG